MTAVAGRDRSRPLARRTKHVPLRKGDAVGAVPEGVSAGDVTVPCFWDARRGDVRRDGRGDVRADAARKPAGAPHRSLEIYIYIYIYIYII